MAAMILKGELQRARILTTVSALVLISLSAVFAPGATVAQQYGPSSQAALSVSATEVAPGQTITISGRGFKAGSTITVVLASTTGLGTATADASGAVSKQVTIPAGVAAGSYTITATGPAPDEGTRVLSRTITVQTQGQGSQQETGGTGLPRTGARIAVLVVTALALFAGGSFLVFSVRRRGKTR